MMKFSSVSILAILMIFGHSTNLHQNQMVPLARFLDNETEFPSHISAENPSEKQMFVEKL